MRKLEIPLKTLDRPTTSVEGEVSAAIVVAGRSTDAEDGAELLAMLGLLAPPERREDGGYCPTLLAKAELLLRRLRRQHGGSQ